MALFGYRHGKGWTLLHDPDAQAKAASPQAELEQLSAPASSAPEVRVPPARDTLRSVLCSRAIEFSPGDGTYVVKDETQRDRPTLAKCKTLEAAEREASADLTQWRRA